MKRFRSSRKQEIFDHYYQGLSEKTDRRFAWLFGFQWVASLVIAYFITPQTWIGNESEIHIHVFAAIFIGGITSALPIFLVLKNPGAVENRYVIATAQMVYSILLIHLTGGRIETHFHVFGSLAFLAFYRDWRPVLLATLITFTDHLVRGVYYPESVYGVITSTPWRAFEHAAWVLFEDVILFALVKDGIDTLDLISQNQEEIEKVLDTVERKVEERTQELRDSQILVTAQQEALAAAAKMSALGEMAGGVAHEINTPLAIIGMKIEQLQESIDAKEYKESDVLETLSVVRKTTDRIAKIVRGLKFFARDGKHVSVQDCKVGDLIQDTLGLCQERFSNHGVKLSVSYSGITPDALILCRSVEISQVLLNLLNNAYDAIRDLPEKWVKIEVSDQDRLLEISVTDSGGGIPESIRDKVMQPFFTTKEVGKGTGLGLSISRGIVESHMGRIILDHECPNTKFRILLPKQTAEAIAA